MSYNSIKKKQKKAHTLFGIFSNFSMQICFINRAGLLFSAELNPVLIIKTLCNSFVKLLREGVHFIWIKNEKDVINEIQK